MSSVYLNENFVGTPTFVFDDFDGKILVPNAEDLKVTKYGFFRLCVTVDLHTEEVTLVLPVKFTLKKEVSKLQETDPISSPTSDTWNRFF